jgi:hypothetical protein
MTDKAISPLRRRLIEDMAIGRLGPKPQHQYKHEWVVYAKRPFGGPDAVLAYLSRYTHRIAIANRRFVAFDGERVTFKWKDYQAKGDARYKLITLDGDEFIRRFLIHILPDGFRRIRHYGLFANANRAGNIIGPSAPRRARSPVEQ